MISRRGSKAALFLCVRVFVLPDGIGWDFPRGRGRG